MNNYLTQLTLSPEEAASIPLGLSKIHMSKIISREVEKRVTAKSEKYQSTVFWGVGNQCRKPVSKF